MDLSAKEGSRMMAMIGPHSIENDGGVLEKNTDSLIPTTFFEAELLTGPQNTHF